MVLAATCTWVSKLRSLKPLLPGEFARCFTRSKVRERLAVDLCSVTPRLFH